MNEKILVPDFSNKEPNLASTRKKNEDGLCCFHECNNKLSEKSDNKNNWYFGFRTCDECGEKCDKIRKQWIDEWNAKLFDDIKEYL